MSHTRNVIEENRETVLEVGFASDFLNKAPKAQSTREKKRLI